MPEFDLDNLKKTWQEQTVLPKYDNSEILQMLNKKSRNYVKYIFWISVLEFLFFSILGVLYIFQNKSSNSFINIIERLGAKRTLELEHSFDTIYLILKILSLAITAFFVLKFYENYRKINIEENLKKLIIRIIQFKKTVNAFIISNIILIIAFTSTITYIVLKTLKSQSIEMNNPKLLAFLLGIMITTIISVSLLWIYYRLAYGIIIKRLDKNLKQLQELDSEEK